MTAFTSEVISMWLHAGTELLGKHPEGAAGPLLPVLGQVLVRHLLPVGAAACDMSVITAHIFTIYAALQGYMRSSHGPHPGPVSKL